MTDEQVDRFWSHVVAGPNGCILWTGCRKESGYGVVAINKVKHAVHRVSYELMVGPIPQGLDLDHTCRTRNCLNHLHLEPVTRQENLRRGYEARGEGQYASHCRSGHAWSDESARHTPQGNRYCRYCNNERAARRALSTAS